MRRIIAAAVGAALMAGPAAAHEARLGPLIIGHPYAVATAAGAPTGAGYFTVTNAGDAADRLLEVDADFPRVELHVSEAGADGVARMRHVEGLEVPAGGVLTLEPRGAHVMFVGLQAPLTAGERIPATLVFERAGSVEVEFHVEPRGAGGGGHDHGG